ncbi:GcrA family cell cycle regulator [Methylovirgula sp. 4M-Z18]|uniref:GcrA family cell cycle regulator n=1 Tax=Methylovirgula sp. 4M-Z18 TaxID=2293567 RepID=UPI000E2E71BD|nr:GcrA family cell cycle regulator [Methylovirgula sp. 4M-Z18]RFB79994.1 hypothetical protein DYH55_00110 [Methylovirgula sp. 4M-Z18]
MNELTCLPGISFLDVQNGCKWPVSGDGLDLRVCGAKVAGKQSYCTPHRLLAYVPSENMEALPSSAAKLWELQPMLRQRMHYTQQGR